MRDSLIYLCLLFGFLARALPERLSGNPPGLEQI